MSINITGASYMPAPPIQPIQPAQQMQNTQVAATEPLVKHKTNIPMDVILSQLSDISATFDKRLSFRLNEKLDQIVVKVIDNSTNKVIREIPPTELQQVHERIKEVIGILFDEKV